MINVAIIGTGAISGIYLQNIHDIFKDVRIIGVCDMVPERARAAQASYHIPKLYPSMHEAFADPEVQVVLNLTRPYEHFDVTKAALEAGKHVYSEKPLAADFEEGKALTELAVRNQLRLGGAPDTFMGAGIQSCRKLIDDGWIGEPIGAACFMICRGHETWHPDPEFYYKRGGGPMLDMGPYYITAIINLLGGISGVSGVVRKNFQERIITSQPHYGETIKVDVPTHIHGIIHFDSGITGSILTTFDVHYAPRNQPRFEVYGSKGTLIVPDPNTFGGPLFLFRPEDQITEKAVDYGLMGHATGMEGYKSIPLMFSYAANSRGLGLADMCRALETGRPMRPDWTQTLHVLEILTAFEKSSEQKAYLPLQTHYTRSAPMTNHTLYRYLD
ncbi:MAG: Gfo/Idh/MocA family oxidoreductase [Clostridia bacterium]|nr:Gfo/Idh/MocA family oxidoreductase [Clostridia bacterium]